MSFVKMIIGLPLIVIIAVFAFVNNDMAVFSLWPFNMEITVSLSVAVIFFIVFGYIVASSIPGFHTRRCAGRCAFSSVRTKN